MFFPEGQSFLRSTLFHNNLNNYINHVNICRNSECRCYNFATDRIWMFELLLKWKTWHEHKIFKTQHFHIHFSIIYILAGVWERTANKFWIKLQNVNFPVTEEVVTSSFQYHTVPRASPDTGKFFKAQKEVVAWGGKHQWRQHEPFPLERKAVHSDFPSFPSSIQTHQASLPSSCHPLAITLRTGNISVLE